MPIFNDLTAEQRMTIKCVNECVKIFFNYSMIILFCFHTLNNNSYY